MPKSARAIGLSRLQFANHAFGYFLLFLLAIFSTSAAAQFTASPRILNQWEMVKGNEVYGRIARLEPWEKYADKEKCKSFSLFCEMLATNLRVGVVSIVQVGSEVVEWPVVIPIGDRLDTGDFVKFRIPEKSNALAEPSRISKTQKLQNEPTCSWTSASDTPDIQGVVCAHWDYRSLSFLW